MTMDEPTALSGTVASGFGQFFDMSARQTRQWTAGMSEEEFWTKPHPYGNSAGHLVLHVTGNLHHFVGRHIAGTSYVRNRDLEFVDPSRRPKEDVLRALDEAVALVVSTVSSQSADDWSRPYAAPGTDDATRLSIVTRCLAHLHHHVGQIIYLAKEHERQRAG
jgi:uncharacterized damage-inducible protein DinB